MSLVEKFKTSIFPYFLKRGIYWLFLFVGVSYVVWVYASIHLEETGFTITGAKYRIGVYFLFLIGTWAVIKILQLQNLMGNLSNFFIGIIPPSSFILFQLAHNFFNPLLIGFLFYSFVCGMLATTAKHKGVAFMLGCIAFILQVIVDIFLSHKYGHFPLT